MGYQRERESFLISMAKYGMSADVARLILRHAQTYHRLSERECNGDDWCEGDTALAKRFGYLVPCPMSLGKHAIRIGACGECGVEDVRREWVSVSPKLARLMGHDYVTKSSVRMTQIERRIRQLAACVNVDDVAVHFQGDPRGWEVSICFHCTCTNSKRSQGCVGVPRKG